MLVVSDMFSAEKKPKIDNPIQKIILNDGILFILQHLMAETVTLAKAHVEAFRNQYDIVVAEDKVMDKAFKREFLDVSSIMCDHLYKLFRKRPR